MKYFKFLAMLLVTAALTFTACSDDGGSDSGGGTTLNPFDAADTPGDSVSVTAGNAEFDMIYANNSEDDVTFPTGTGDDGTAEITAKFFMGKNEVTWELWCEVYIWATGDEDMDGTINGDEIAGDYTFQNFGTKGNDGDAGKSIEHPVTDISWRDAIIWCNALSEMTGAEVVYRDKDDENVILRDSRIAVEDRVEEESVTLNRKGFRLPTSMEWEYAARYRGTDTTNVVTGIIDGTDFSAMATKWTKGNSASGATLAHDDVSTDTGDYAWYSANSGSSTHVVGTAGNDGGAAYSGNANTLGLYDMCGNVMEWCFTADGSLRGGSWSNNAPDLQVGDVAILPPDSLISAIGFRLARTQ